MRLTDRTCFLTLSLYVATSFKTLVYHNLRRMIFLMTVTASFSSKLLVVPLACLHSIQQCQDIAFSCASISIAPSRIDSGYRNNGGAVSLCNGGRIPRRGIARATGRASHIYINSAFAGPNAQRQRLSLNSIDTCYSLSTVQGLQANNKTT